jgi:hypothetical protein
LDAAHGKRLPSFCAPLGCVAELAHPATKNMTATAAARLCCARNGDEDFIFLTALVGNQQSFVVCGQVLSRVRLAAPSQFNEQATHPYELPLHLCATRRC